MKTKEMQVAENFADFRQLLRESGLGPCGRFFAATIAIIIGLIAYSLMLGHGLFAGLRYRKYIHRVSFDKRMQVLYPRSCRRIGRRMAEDRAFIRSEMGR